MSDIEEAADHVNAPQTPADAAPDDSLRVTSLRPASRVFSMRRLLNGASITVAAILLLALAIHWLPGIFSARTTHPAQTRTVPSLLARGAGWEQVGPDWALDIAFTADGALGYVCGEYPPNPLVSFGVYDVHQNTWKQLPSPAAGGGGCRVSVSPVDPADVVLINYGMVESSNGAPHAQVYRSLDGGATWTSLHLPASQVVTDVDWTNRSTLLLAVQQVPASGVTTPPPYSLLASRGYGPLSEITAQQLVGDSTPFGPISLWSSGATIYAALDGFACTSYCTTLVRSSDEGRHWSRFAATYQGNPLVPAAAQPNSDILIGWVSLPQSQTVQLLHSDDNGTHWRALPQLPVNPFSSGAAIYALPDGTVFAWCYAPANRVYALGAGASAWQAMAPLSGGASLAVQHDVRGHVVGLWAQAYDRTSNAMTPGLEYYPLAATTP